MKLPSVFPWDRWNRKLLLIIAGCAAALGVVFCIAAVALGSRSSQEVPQATAETAETATPESTEAPRAADLAVQTAAVGTVLPQTSDAGRSYVDETLFIGDSNTARYLMYADETGQAFTTLDNNIGVVSMGAGAITTLKCEKFKGSSTMYTVPEAVAMLKPQRIIICYGTNNLSGSSTDATNFISTYLKGLQAIQTAWPYCDIIVSAIPPLDKQRENTNLTMTQVDAYNAALVKMCEENGFKFLNSAEILRDSTTGWAKTDYTLSDGVHLSKTAVTAYFQYVRTHAYVTEDRRPQPLGTIPTPDGVPANLISEDPIAIRGAKVPLEFVATNGGTLSGSTSQLVKKGGTASAVTAVPDEGFVFAGWTASTGGSYSSATISFTMPTDANAGGVVLTAHFKADAHEHNYVEVKGSKVAATCQNAGSVQYKCSICGEVIEKELPALGHDWDGGNQNGDQMAYTCRRCGQTKSETIAHTHNFSELISHTPSSCKGPETLVYKCSCGATTTTYGQGQTDHSWDGCVQSGDQIIYTCTVCGQQRYEAAPPPTPVDPPSSGSESGSSSSGGDGGTTPPDGGEQGGDQGSGGEGGDGSGGGGDVVDSGSNSTSTPTEGGDTESPPPESPATEQSAESPAPQTTEESE